MPAPTVPFVTVSPTGPMLIFDGDCGFCTSSANWAARGWSRPVQAQAWQLLGAEQLAELGLSVAQAQEAAWWVDPDGRLFRGHRAMGKALAAGGGWRRLVGLVILVPPGSWVAAGAYPVIARWRHRMPGGTSACRTGHQGEERAAPLDS